MMAIAAMQLRLTIPRHCCTSAEVDGPEVASEGEAEVEVVVEEEA